MNDLKIYCDDYDFTPLAASFFGEFESDCTLAAEIVFVDEEEIRRLNRELRSVDSVTDVLSFPSLDGILDKKVIKDEHLEDVDEEGNLVIGSIAICTQRAKEQADEYGHSYTREINYLATHGICHLLGYDHMQDDEKAAMREKEERVLMKINATRD
jgi:probable rRNA maturation factor